MHNRARNAVEAAHKAIRSNTPFETRDLEEAVQSIVKLLKENSNIFLFLYGLDEGKDYTLTHSVNVTFYSLIIGIALKYNPVKLNDLGLGTLLIDAGMIKLPVYIIHKQSNLTDQEYNQIKTHPLLGYKALKDLGKIKESSAIISLQHHEQFDGKGYPRGPPRQRHRRVRPNRRDRRQLRGADLEPELPEKGLLLSRHAQPSVERRQQVRPGHPARVPLAHVRLPDRLHRGAE